MLNNGLMVTSLLALTLLTTACAVQKDLAESTAPDLFTSPYDPDPNFKLKINGQDAPGALDSEQKITNLLDELGAPDDPKQSKRIDELLKNPTVKLAGAGGGAARSALYSAAVTLGASGKYKDKIQFFDVSGQIQKQVNGKPGFFYKAGQPMHIWVQVITTAFRATGSGNFKGSARAEMFRVEIPAIEITVEPKENDSTKNDNGKDMFPKFKYAGGFAIDVDKAKPFNYKLWAVGKDIQVTDYWVDENYDPNKGAKYNQKYNMNDSNIPKKYKNIFDTSLESCFDMMFKKDPNGDGLVNGELPPNAAPPDYCLGRCSKPPIVNTR